MRLLHFSSVVSSIAAGTFAQLHTEYDYIVCGGGTGGLAVANRLSEGGASVLVVEAGINGTTEGWDYHSLPQAFVDGRVLDLPAGKTVGGSSQINGKVYSRPDQSEIDDWGTVNNAGWSWATLFPFYKKSESLRQPSEDQQEAGFTYNEDFHGYDGPLNVSFPGVSIPEFFAILEETAANFSIPLNKDFNGGQARGLATYPASFRISGSREQFRESAREAYYLPVVGRKNLELIDETSCLRIVWDNSSGDTLTASGVEIANVDTQTTISARKEVILSTGVYRSPGILEYSGVGNPKILASHDIESVIDLPGVGENVQDQAQGTIYFLKNNESAIVFPERVGDEITTNYLMHLTYEDIFGDDASNVQERINASLPDYADRVSERINGSLSSAQILKSLQIQYAAIFETRVPVVELFTGQSLANDQINFEFWPLIPLSRGNVHISGGNPELASDSPFIDKNWFMLEYDWDIYIGSGRLVRRLFHTAPLAAEVTDEASPGLEALAEDASDDEWKQYWGENFRAGWHAVGSAAMLPREWGGVVDGDLKVYGTGNVRVVDASVIPFQLGGHPTSTVYALAERAATLILTGQSG